MSKKKKLARFAENETFPHLFQVSFNEINEKPFHLKGLWKSEYFGNNNPLVIELGCGKGEYTVGMARSNPECNYIGIDIKGARLWKGCKCVEEEKLINVAFIRTKIQNIEQFFAPGEVQEIWITFPDPQPGLARERKRLTSPWFINRYKNILGESGLIHLKTDDMNLYDYTLDVFRSEKIDLIFSVNDLHKSDYKGLANSITTYYEKIWLDQGSAIKYLLGKTGSNYVR